MSAAYDAGADRIRGVCSDPLQLVDGSIGTAVAIDIVESSAGEAYAGPDVDVEEGKPATAPEVVVDASAAGPSEDGGGDVRE